MREQLQNKMTRNGESPAALAFGKLRKFTMSEKMGEIARESSDYRCERCHQVTRITRGALIPPCPHCGYGTYDISNPRFERQDGSLGPHEPG
jgi:Zn finger protein HypA/HybF involved in hydrogenase expression